MTSGALQMQNTYVCVFFLHCDSYYQQKADCCSYTFFLDMWALDLFVYFCIIVHFYLQGYFYNDDTFNFNYAQAKAALGNYKEAEEVP